MINRMSGSMLILISAICWSLGGVLIKMIPLNPIAINGVRSFLAFIVVGFYAKWPRIQLSRGNIITAASMVITNNLFVYANKLTTAANAIVLQYTAPVFILIITALFQKKKPTGRDIVTILVVFMGISLFFFDKIDGGGLLGNILALASGLSFAGIFIGNQLPDTKPSQALLLGFIVNSFIGLPFLFSNLGAMIYPSAWIAALILGVVQMGVAYIAFSAGITKTNALSASLISSVEPILNPVWVFFATKEQPGKFAIFGAAIVITAITIYNTLEVMDKRSK